MNTTFKSAVKSAMPIITVTHGDVLNVGTLINHLSGSLSAPYPLSSESDPTKATLAKTKLSSFDIFYTIDPEFKCSAVLYEWLVENEKVLVLVNGVANPYSFNAGELSIPDTLIISSLKGILDLKTIEASLPILKGLTLKEITDLIRITTAGSNQVNANTLTKNRGLVSVDTPGLCKVDTTIPVYFKNPELEDFIALNKDYFTNKNMPLELVPRGILLTGIAGVGKTLAAKYLANVFNVPLYRIDLSVSLSKYVGSSERNLATILTSISQESACVLLLDEAEKLFGESSDSGVTSRLLAQLLWFLQEHKKHILTVITTNDISKLPPELYRKGRVDTVITMNALTLQDARQLAYKVVSNFVELTPVMGDVTLFAVNAYAKDYPDGLTPANITGLAQNLIKKHNWLAPSKVK